MPDIFRSKDEISKKSHPLSDTIHGLYGHSHNPLSSFCYFPDHVRFINEDPGEKVVLLLRKHPVTNLGWITVALLMLIAPFFFSAFTVNYSLPSNIEIMLGAAWYLITSSFVLEKFLTWFFNVNIITDERIIEVDFLNLFYREISDANIDQIQDVTVEIGGGIRTLLNFGDVLIQTAAEVPKIELESVPSPDKVAKVLRELRIEEEVEKLEGRVR